MEKRHDLRLQMAVLQIIKYKGDISQIAGGIYTYSDIGKVINDLKSNGMARDLSGEIEITKIGEVYLKELIVENGMKGKNNFILHQYKYFGRKINKSDIYLSNKDTTH
ncbi:hypothetical protein COI76_15730 [Bacillus cereus]|uniref:hypothetical protein n=1 Tax=Bacillus cereus group TaxID=86661 RepID=UPI000BF43F8C|nr:hypothetical protein [Bacillus thuringiensis]PFI53288.1 hypothetical protein COI76_15730 [Bacillus cereus]PFV95833.1 hypothetical protein COL21_14380 [Bacillus thuringiensis]